jgi:hypothetical protein
MQDIKVRLSKDPPEFPDWLHVDSASIADIITSLDYWSKLTDSKTTAGMLRFHVPHTPGTGTNMEILNNPNISPEYRAKLQDSMVAKRQQIGDMLDSMDDSLLRQAGWIEQGQTPAQAREFLTEHREEAIELMLKAQLDGNVTSGMDKEQEWYNTTKTFMPPAELWNRHPGYANFRRFQQGKTKLPKEVKTSVSQADPPIRFILIVIVRSRGTSKQLGSPMSPYLYASFHRGRDERTVYIYLYRIKPRPVLPSQTGLLLDTPISLWMRSRLARSSKNIMIGLSWVARMQVLTQTLLRIHTRPDSLTGWSKPSKE